MPDRSNDVDFFPGTVQKWGLGYMINTEPGPNGRSAGSLAGPASSTPITGSTRQRVTGLIMTQILPFADPPTEALRAVRARRLRRPEGHLTAWPPHFRRRSPQPGCAGLAVEQMPTCGNVWRCSRCSPTRTHSPPVAGRVSCGFCWPRARMLSPQRGPCRGRSAVLPVDVPVWRPGPGSISPPGCAMHPGLNTYRCRQGRGIITVSPGRRSAIKGNRCKGLYYTLTSRTRPRWPCSWTRFKGLADAPGSPRPSPPLPGPSHCGRTVPTKSHLSYGNICPKQIASFPATKRRVHNHRPMKSASYTPRHEERSWGRQEPVWSKSSTSGGAGGRQTNVASGTVECARRHLVRGVRAKHPRLSRRTICSRSRPHPCNQRCMSCRCGSLLRSNPQSPQWNLPNRRSRPKVVRRGRPRLSKPAAPAAAKVRFRRPFRHG